MKTLLSTLVLLIALAGQAFATPPAAPPGNVHDNVCDDDDLGFLMTSPYPGNLTSYEGGTHVYVSPAAGGYIPAEGTDFICNAGSTNQFEPCTLNADCTGGNCSTLNHFASKERPLKSIWAAALIMEMDGCGYSARLDSGDPFYNLALGNALLEQNGFVGAGANCADPDNRRLAAVLQSWPPNTRAYLNFAWQTDTGTNLGALTDGIAGTDPDVIVAAVPGESDANTIGNAAHLGLVVDELVGGMAYVTGTPGVCPLAIGDIEEILSNTADLIETNTFAGGVTDDCEFTIVAASASEGSTSKDHFRFNTANGGVVAVIGLDVWNVYEEGTFTQTQKDPSSAFASWGVVVHSVLPGPTSGIIFHLNSPATSWFIQTEVREIDYRIPINTSGNSVVIGSSFTISETNTQSNIAKLSGVDNLVIESTFYGFHNAASSSRSALAMQGNTGIPTTAEYTVIRSTVGGSVGENSGALRVNPTYDSMLSYELRVLASSIIDSDVGISVGVENADTYAKAITATGNLFDGLNLKYVSSSNNETEQIKWDIHSNSWDSTEIALDGWDLSVDDLDTVAQARTDIEGTTGATCAGVSGDCSAGFFTGAHDLLNTKAHEGVGGIDDHVPLGGCHKDRTCFQGLWGLFTILETVREPLRLLPWMLPSGEECRVWHLWTTGDARSYGRSM